MPEERSRSDVALLRDLDLLRAGRWYTLADAGATPNIEGKSAVRISNSAPQNITNFLGGVEGQVLILQFVDTNSTVTLANAFLKGGVNFVSTSPAMLVLVNRLGSWLEISRSLNHV